MGSFSIEPKLGRQGNKVDIPVIKVQRIGEVISALIGVPSVSSLPFLPNIARLRAAA